MGVTPVILIHALAALAAVVFGGIALMLKKGTRPHRLCGRIWVVLMLVAALVSFGIQKHGHLSVVHLLSVISLAAVGAAVVAAAHGRIRAHRRGMTGAYAGLLIAGVFTLLPGRLLGDLIWGAGTAPLASTAVPYAGR